MDLQLVERNPGQHFLIEIAVGQPEAEPEAFAVERLDPVEPEHVVGGLQDRRQVVHQGAGPVEDEIVEHEGWMKG